MASPRADYKALANEERPAIARRAKRWRSRAKGMRGSDNQQKVTKIRARGPAVGLHLMVLLLLMHCGVALVAMN
jgi:hypothetical protein